MPHLAVDIRRTHSWRTWVSISCCCLFGVYIKYNMSPSVSIRLGHVSWVFSRNKQFSLANENWVFGLTPRHTQDNTRTCLLHISRHITPNQTTRYTFRSPSRLWHHRYMCTRCYTIGIPYPMYLCTNHNNSNTNTGLHTPPLGENVSVHLFPHLKYDKNVLWQISILKRIWNKPTYINGS